MRLPFLLYSIPTTIVCLLLGLCSFSQNLLAPDQPEQDACNALYLCGGKFSSPYSYQQTGKIIDLATTSCGGGEDNSMWIRVTIAVAGSLVFNIIPVDPADDYDFAVLNSTNTTCDKLTVANVVRCNFNNNTAGSNVNGIVGLSMSGTATGVPGGAFGNSFCKYIDAVAGETYLIMINNFGNYTTGGVSAGFTIDFSGSTAIFGNELPPALAGYDKQCSDSSVIVELSSRVACNSIAADGSDFYITPSIPISSAIGKNCINGSGYTSQVEIHFAAPAQTGNYVLHAQNGADGNTVLDFCNNPMLLSASLPFVIPHQVASGFLPADTTKCFYSTISIDARGGFGQYLWSTGQTTQAIKVIDPGVYTLMATDTSGCVGVDSIVIKDSTCPEYLYLPTAFTPNADGKNDLFRPKFAGVAVHYAFSIYNRWGQRIFQSTDPSQGWDGSLSGKTQAPGTYVWICSYQLYKKEEHVEKGTVMLIR